jgi:hypothetical protein
MRQIFSLFLGLIAFLPFTQSNPSILEFTSDTRMVDYLSSEDGTAAVNLSWNVAGMTPDECLQLYAQRTGDWILIGHNLNPTWSGAVPIPHPRDFGWPAVRLSVVNANNEILVDSYIQFGYQWPEYEDVPRIESFTVDASAISAEALRTGTLQIPVHWSIKARQPHFNSVFEQILPDGKTVSVELPRDQIWLPSIGDGLIAPIQTSESVIKLQMRLIDVFYTERTFSTAYVEIPVTDSSMRSVATTQGTIVSVSDMTSGGFGDETYQFETDHLQIQRGGTLTVNWNIPFASRVWIEQHSDKKPRCESFYHEPDVVYGPLERSGSMQIPLPAEYDYATWFDIYVDSYIPFRCDYSRWTSKDIPPIDVQILLNPYVDYFMADTDRQGAGTYEVVPGSWVTLRWSIQDTDEIYMTGLGEFEVRGPLPAVGTMEVCPRSGSGNYTLYAGGKPDEVPGVSLFIWVPPSTHYPANMGEGNPCWEQEDNGGNQTP